jgi:hypothetical protein
MQVYLSVGNVTWALGQVGAGESIGTRPMFSRPARLHQRLLQNMRLAVVSSLSLSISLDQLGRMNPRELKPSPITCRRAAVRLSLARV